MPDTLKPPMTNPCGCDSEEEPHTVERAIHAASEPVDELFEIVMSMPD